jgi:NAD(P)-dependent dehydrogenase (short-subunit alcohol dehydrogenase family)
MPKIALIIGTGSGISAAFARALHAEGYRLALAARTTTKVAGLGDETGADLFAADATDSVAVAGLFAELDRRFGRLDVVLYNASYRTRGAFLELNPAKVRRSIEVSGRRLPGSAASRQTHAGAR